jgi:hypothetical protein
MKFESLVNQILEQQIQVLDKEERSEDIVKDAGAMAKNMFSGMWIDKQLADNGFSNDDINMFWGLVNKKNMKEQEAFEYIKSQKSLKEEPKPTPTPTPTATPAPTDRPYLGKIRL